MADTASKQAVLFEVPEYHDLKEWPVRVDVSEAN